MSIKKYILSDNNVLCDVCGKKRKRSECTMAYGSGMIPVVMSCRDGCADYNHPLNYSPPIIFDGRPVQDARPEGTNVYITTTSNEQEWGHFSPKMAWGAINGTNNQFQLNPIWTWGNFP